MKNLEEGVVDWLSDDEFEEPEMNPKYDYDSYALTDVPFSDHSLSAKAFQHHSATNPSFSAEITDQVPILLDLGTTKSLIKPIQAYTEYVKLHETLKIGKHPEVTITGIGHVGGLRDVLQPESTSTPALLSLTNYLEAWPNSIVLTNAERARIYETSMDKFYNSTAALLEDIPNLPIVTEFIQKSNM
jgi:hypothetical protein